MAGFHGFLGASLENLQKAPSRKKVCFDTTTYYRVLFLHSRKVLEDTVSFALQHTQLTKSKLRTVKHYSNLYYTIKTNSRKKTLIVALIQLCKVTTEIFANQSETYILSVLSKISDKNNCGDDSLILLKNTNGQKCIKSENQLEKPSKMLALRLKLK